MRAHSRFQRAVLRVSSLSMKAFVCSSITCIFFSFFWISAVFCQIQIWTSFLSEVYLLISLCMCAHLLSAASTLACISSIANWCSAFICSILHSNLRRRASSSGITFFCGGRAPSPVGTRGGVGCQSWYKPRSFAPPMLARHSRAARTAGLSIAQTQTRPAIAMAKTHRQYRQDRILLKRSTSQIGTASGGRSSSSGSSRGLGSLTKKRRTCEKTLVIWEKTLVILSIHFCSEAQ
mmetsp:Transcript_62229/g.145894  ORF Transcript_62229/g.145894 Transcript_62229/m.145894 type:complete len:235 (+) Transcript_62229:304-1008(+)